MLNNLKKGEILIYVIAFMLVAAGYLNYKSNNNETEETYSEDIANIGDAVLVSNNGVIEEYENNTNENSENILENNIQETISKDNNVEEDYFISSKLERDTMYANILASYMSILENNDIQETQKSIANQEIQKINDNKNKIMICENLLSTKGFEKCIIYVNNESINIVIGQEEELKVEQVAKIQNIISREMATSIENIHITQK